MSNKTSKNLQLAAVILFGLALLSVIAATVFQQTVKQIYHTNPSALKITSVPWPALVSCALYLILSIVCLVVIAKQPSRGKAIALTVIAAILFAAFSAVITPAVSTATTMTVSRQGADHLASYVSLTQAASFVSNVFSIPASILMLLSLGGCIPKKQ